MAYIHDRKLQLEQSKAEMQQMFDRRNQLEQDFLERYLSQVEAYQQNLFDMQVNDAQDFNTLKIQLEGDRQNLERHMEAMLATYQLNIEKLDYNYRVLIERDHENSSTINQQKRKIARQRDLLTNLKAKWVPMRALSFLCKQKVWGCPIASALLCRYHASDKKFHEANMKLTAEYKRITEQFKDLQQKFKHFELSDSKKYAEVWKMKEGHVVGLARKLMEADKVLHEQQMGLSWRPPKDEVNNSWHSRPPHVCRDP
jgi:dynein regulatry complex protein 1